jgi:integrase
MNLDTFFDTTYRPLRLRGKSANTLRLYGCLFRAFDRFLERPATVADAGDELTVLRFLDHRAASGRSPYTIEKERSQLMALAKIAHQRGLLTTMPIVPQGTLPEAAPVAWSVEQLQHLVETAARQTGNVGSVRACEFWPCLLLVLFETGERITAVMQTPSCNYTRPYILVPAAVRKGGKRDRVYLLTESTCDRLDRIVQANRTLFFWQGAATYLWGKMKRIVQAAGLDRGRGFRFHAIRRSTASWFAANGGDATAALDHSSPRLTRRWYLDPRIADTSLRPAQVLPRIDTAITHQKTE